MKVIKAKNQLTFFAIGSIFMLIGLSTLKGVISQRINQTYTLNDGVQTCFGRVGQSYTAKVIGDKLSPYLSSDFLKTTEDCFAEALSMNREKMGYLSNQVEEKLNTLAEDVHWYHEKLNAQAASGLNPVPQNVIIANLGTRFQKLEQNRNSLIEMIEQNREVLTTRNSYATWAFFIIAPFVLAFSGLRMWKEWGSENEQSSAEAIAAASTAKATQAPIIQDNSDVIASAISDKIGPMVALASTKAEETQKKIDQLWEEFNKEDVKADETAQNIQNDSAIKLSDAFTNVMDVLSSKIFTTGFNVDFEFDENIRVLAKDEALEQIIYHVITNSINSYDFDKENKLLSVTSKKLGGTLLLSFIDRGRGFDKSFLKSLSLGEQNIDNPQYLELMICRELVKEFKGLISFENIAGKNGNVLGAKVELVLRIDPSYIEETKQSKLINLVKGKKRDVMRRMGRDA